MVYIQWQKEKDGKAVKQVVWPEAAATAAAMVCPAVNRNNTALPLPKRKRQENR